MKINNNIKNILEQGEFKENIFFLPKIQLDRKDYLEVNKVLESLGGKWNKGKKGHIFDGTQEELEGALFEVLEKGETVTLDEIKKQFQYFPTPEKVARAMIEEAELKEIDTVLEPSAGQGAIMELFYLCNSVVGIELNKENFEILKNKNWIGDVEILNMDFLEYNKKKFNKIIANPPFAKNQDVKHILHMYNLLEKGGRIVSVASSMIQHKNTKYHQELMKLNPEFIGVEEGAFKESGTMVNTCIVVINK